MPLKSWHEDDRGITIVLVTASLLFIFGIAAIAVDGGLGWSERRQAQSGVDFAALAALNFAKSCQDASNPCDIDLARNRGAQEAIDVVAGNLPERTLDWATCTDPGPRPGFIPSGLTDCVSFTENNGKSRVYLPTDAIDTTFGRVLGMNQLFVRAHAEAEQHLNVSASVIPFSPRGGGPELCLFTNQMPQAVPPCDGPSTGHFGYVDLALFGNDDLGTPSTCEQGNQNSKVAINIALGSDHILTAYDPLDPVVNDHDACPNRSEDINELVIEAGSPTNVPTTDGLFAGVNTHIVGNPISASPRLRCTGASTACVDVRGRSMDHTSLWEYLLPGKCASANDHVSMAQCLQAWDGSVYFDSNISENLRFAAVPDISPTANPLRWRIARFLPVWVETIYLGCNPNSCDTVHSPGEPTVGTCPNPFDQTIFSCGWTPPSNTNLQIEQVTAFELQLGMLPHSIRDFFPGVGQTRSTALSR